MPAVRCEPLMHLQLTIERSGDVGLTGRDPAGPGSRPGITEQLPVPSHGSISGGRCLGSGRSGWWQGGGEGQFLLHDAPGGRTDRQMHLTPGQQQLLQQPHTVDGPAGPSHCQYDRVTHLLPKYKVAMPAVSGQWRS